MSGESSIASRLAAARAAVSDAVHSAGRTSTEVRIVAVSKTISADAICEAFQAGQNLFGENYVQEFIAKLAVLKTESGITPEFHFIGHLQRNKVKHVVGACALIHSVDRLELAEEIDREARKRNLRQAVLMQINTSEESTKGGMSFAGAEVLAQQIASLKNVELRGLMSIGAVVDNPLDASAEFQNLRELRDQLRAKLKLELPELSMGMSADFREAIAEGATLVRIGTAIFGPRK